MTAPLIDYLDRRIALVDSISASLIARRQTRPQSRQSYQERALREHGKRMTAFWASPFGTPLSPSVEPAGGLAGFAASIADAAQIHQGEQ